jgi:hypothetical protein
LISASKSVNLAASLVSLYAFQAAVFAQFRAEINPAVITLCNVASANIACIVVFYISMHIIVRATRALRGQEDLYIVVEEAKTSYQKEFRSDVSAWIANAGNANLPDWARQYSEFSNRFNTVSEGTVSEGTSDGQADAAAEAMVAEAAPAGAEGPDAAPATEAEAVSDINLDTQIFQA